MAYSRWSNSIWYTFWTSNCSEECDYKLPTKKLKNNQYFEICDFGRILYFSYKEINENVDSCIEKVVDKYSQEIEGQIWSGFNDDGSSTYKDVIYEPKTFSQEELDELKGYMLEFKKDVDDSFNLKEFFYMNWYVPLRNKYKLSFKLKLKKYYEMVFLRK